MNDRLTKTKCKIIDWIGSDGTTIENMTNWKAEILLDWLERVDFSVETDMEKLKMLMKVLE